MELQIQQTALLERWLFSLRDMRARIAIARRIDRVSRGNFGDTRALVMACLNFGWISGPATAFTTCGAETRSFC